MVMWTLYSSGLYLVQRAWQPIRSHGSPVRCHKLVWFGSPNPYMGYNPVACFQERLCNKDRLAKMGGNKFCRLCSRVGKEETHRQLFSEWCLSAWIWSSLLNKCGVTRTPMNLANVIEWDIIVGELYSGRGLQASFICCCLSCLGR